VAWLSTVPKEGGSSWLPNKYIFSLRSSQETKVNIILFLPFCSTDNVKAFQMLSPGFRL
jgi:hypothetical protein